MRCGLSSKFFDHLICLLYTEGPQYSAVGRLGQLDWPLCHCVVVPPFDEHIIIIIIITKFV